MSAHPTAGRASEAPTAGRASAAPATAGRASAAPATAGRASEAPATAGRASEASRGLTTLLVANRGEIALRIMRTCRELGIRTVAVFTDLDADAPHVRAADEAYEVAGYLDADAIVAAAQRAGADAIHPGYGFLSERAAFAEAVTAAGLTFVGPSADVIALMGRKDAAREVAVAAGVPVVPRSDPADGAVTFPVLVKAVAGGGGKGMRIVHAAAEYDDALAAAKREAKAAFGDDTVLVERYVERGRHVEVQVFGDAHGNVVHLFERDCSSQRRHQKVIEEAPSPVVDAGLRERLTSAAVALATHVGYTNAGTVEFLVDAETGDFFFLEMNTRLQVEHPVTEAINGGLDLVALQLRVASGLPLDVAQDDLRIDGHSFEARIYAEDPYAGFLPQAGRASLVRWPEAVRVDTALESGQVVTTAYDPMLAKVIVHGPDRETARRALVGALDRTAVLGLTTNTGFLRELAASDAMRDAQIDTGWLDRTDLTPPDPTTARAIAAWTDVAVASMIAGPGPFQPDGWRSGASPAPVRVELDEPVLVDRTAGTAGQIRVREVRLKNHTADLVVDGARVRAVVNAQPDGVDVALHGQRYPFARLDPVRAHGGEAVGDADVLSPMPGTILSIAVEVGETVEAGQVLGIVEAMKMELALKAPYDGIVAAVGAKAGEQVALGALLFTVEEDA